MANWNVEPESSPEMILATFTVTSHGLIRLLLGSIDVTVPSTTNLLLGAAAVPFRVGKSNAVTTTVATKHGTLGLVIKPFAKLSQGAFVTDS
jgi:hypothetical protein